MSLRVRLAMLILALVAVLALALSALQLQTLVDTLTENASQRADLAAQRVGPPLIENIRLHVQDYPVPESLEQTIANWNEIVATDRQIDQSLTDALRIWNALVEINIADASGLIVKSTTPENTGKHLRPNEKFSDWRTRPWYLRALDLLQRQEDWDIHGTPIGIEGSSDTVFQIQVVASPVILKNELMPPLQNLMAVLATGVVLSLLLTLIVTHQAMLPLMRIEQIVDRIAQGSYKGGAEKDRVSAKEFLAVESKLNLLGQQMREVMDSPRESPHRLDVVVERMASQLDVASRLAAISRLSGGVAHEIKNPLNAILLRLDLLKARLGDSDDLTPELDVLSKEVLRLDRVVKTFLDFSRPLEVNFEDVDVAAVVREVAELMKPQAALSKIEIECSVPDEAAIIRGDSDLLKQAVLNLVTNAVEAMPNGGSLRCSVDPDDGNWAVEIADNGPGIPPERRDKVFQLYFTTKTKGSGIGLAMTYRAVQLHNGVISFSSEGGKGTTFRMEFPATVRHA